MSHTKGPWEAHIGPDYFAIYNVAGEPVVPEYRCNPETEHDIANARLMAAAPQMLKVLQEISEWADNRMDIDWNGQPNNAMEVWGMLGDIIAKATGGDL